MPKYTDEQLAQIAGVQLKPKKQIEPSQYTDEQLAKIAGVQLQEPQKESTQLPTKEELIARHGKSRELPFLDIPDILQSALSGASTPQRAIQQLIRKVTDPAGELPQPYEYQPKSFGGEIAKFGGELLPTLPLKAGEFGLDVGIGAIIGGVTAAERGEDIPEILKQTAIGGGIGGVGGLIPRGIGKGIEKVAPHFAEFMAKIPKEKYRQAAEQFRKGIDPFKGKFDEEKVFQELAKKEIVGTQRAKQLAGEKISKEAGKLTPKEVINVEDLLSSMKTQVQKTQTGGADISASFEAIEPILRESLEKYIIRPSIIGKASKLGKLTPEMDDLFTSITRGKNLSEIPLGNVNEFKKALQGKINWADEASSLKNNLLEQLEFIVNEKIKPKATELANANAIFAKIQKVKKEVGKITPGKLSKADSRTNLLNNYQKNLKELDNLLPVENRISDALEQALLRQSFEQTGSLGGFWAGRALGFGAIGGAGGLAGIPALALAPAMLYGLAATSPKIQQQLLRGQVLGGKYLQPALQQIIPRVGALAATKRD